MAKYWVRNEAGGNVLKDLQLAGEALLGPGSATDNAAVRFDGTTGKLGQNSLFIIDDAGNVSSFGGQIVFPATQNPSAGANTFTDFEKGTFTPVVTFATPGNLAVTYASQTGRYTKIDRLVVFSILLRTTVFTHTTAASFFKITGLPFTPSTAFLGAGSISMSGYTKAGFTGLALEIGAAAELFVLAYGSGAAAIELVAGDVPTGGPINIYASGFYET